MAFWIWFGITFWHSVWSTTGEMFSASVSVAGAFLIQAALRQDEGDDE